MVDNTQISHLLQEQLNLNIREDYLTSESYLLGTDELDSELLPTNFYNVMTSASYLIIFFYFILSKLYIIILSFSPTTQDRFFLYWMGIMRCTFELLGV